MRAELGNSGDTLGKDKIEDRDKVENSVEKKVEVDRVCVAPTGTVTFLLSDVVSSTELWQRFPDQMPDAIRQHEQIMRAALISAGGYEFGTAGDSFAVAFSSAASAVAAAVEAQRALESHPWGDARIRVRIGLHSGETEERDGRYFGPVVNLAARIEATAAPGQVLLSAVTWTQARASIQPTISFKDLGERTLKSFEQPERLIQVVADGLAPEIVPITEADRLPNPPTTFVGRSDDIDNLSGLILPGELVTVTGLGGLGKTRLSIETARRCADRFPDGIWWVDLSPLTEDSSIGLHTANALGIAQQSSKAIEDLLIDALSRQQALVVFDNCEHVLDEAASLIAVLRDGCPNLGLLATSREPLELAGEQNWPLATMTAATDGVALLLDRARTHDAKLDLSRWRWPQGDLIDLCERLDGMPLGIEMAAARLRALSPREIIERLDDRFQLLKSRDRQVAPRHQTLRAALDWSYDLLDADERMLLDRLSIFAGSFDVRAAELVCTDDRLAASDVLDLVSSLLEKSLISQIEGLGSTRYRLLETVRAYCLEHLSEPEIAVLRRSLIQFCVDIALTHEPLWLGDFRQGFDQASAAFSNEWDNFRMAIRWAVENRNAAACDSIFRALWVFAFETLRTEIGDWARSALVMDPQPIMAVGVAAVTSNERSASLRLLEAGLASVDETVANHEACLLYGVLNAMYMTRGGDKALKMAERCVFHAAAMSVSREASHRANFAMQLVEVDAKAAAEHAHFAQDYLDRSANPWRAACVAPLAMYEAKRGHAEVGHELCVRGHEIAVEGGMAWSTMSALACRAGIALRYNVGDPLGDLIEAITVGRSLRAWYGVWVAMAESVAWLKAHAYHEVATVIADFMASRNIWFRGADTHSTVAAIDGETTDTADIDHAMLKHKSGRHMRQDELIDYVLEALKKQSVKT